MRQRYLGLRSILTAAMLVIVAVATAVSITLVVLTNRLHAASEGLADTVESVRLANEAEIDLLLHGRTKDALARRGFEHDLRATLANLRPFVSSAAEAKALGDVSERVERYFEAFHSEPAPTDLVETRYVVAYEALDALVDINVAHARNARGEVARWDWLANRVGLGTALGLLVASAWFLWWLRARAFRPVFSLLRSMERFGRGDREVRADEEGPSELHELARRFNEMAAALVAQREVQTSFLGGVVHDLRNPLAALKLATAVARRRDRSPADVNLARLGDQADRQISRMERMLGDLLDTVRIEAGKLDLQLEWRDMRELVRDVASSFEATSPKHDLVVDVPDNEVWVRCDSLRIEQVLSNLISNAIKFSPRGGRVAIELRRQDGEAILSVADSGIGISEADQQRLFEPFRRVGPSRDAIPGVGLGLFVVREIIRAHRGRVEVASVPGRGTTFRALLSETAPSDVDVDTLVRGSDGQEPLAP